MFVNTYSRHSCEEGFLSNSGEMRYVHRWHSLFLSYRGSSFWPPIAGGCQLVAVDFNFYLSVVLGMRIQCYYCTSVTRWRRRRKAASGTGFPVPVGIIFPQGWNFRFKTWMREKCQRNTNFHDWYAFEFLPENLEHKTL